MANEPPFGLEDDERPISRNDVNEVTPLLPTTTTLQASRRDSNAGSSIATKGRRIRVVALCALVACLATAVRVFMLSPVLKITENRVCYNYYHEHEPGAFDPGEDIDEEHCKRSTIQVEVATITAVTGVVTSLITTTVAIPYGILADRYSRRLVLFLNALGITLYYVSIGFVGFSRFLPPRLMIVSGLFQLLGGGTRVNTAILYAVIADVAEPTTRIDFFYYLELADYATELLAPPAAFLALGHDLIFAFAIGVGLCLLTLGSVSLLPETRPVVTDGEPHRDHSSSDDASSISSHSSGPSHHLTHHADSVLGSPRKFPQVRRVLHRAKNAIQFSKNNGAITIILIIVLVAYCAKTSMYILPQYASKDFQWPVRTTAYLSSIRALVELVLFWILLPGIKKLSLHRGFTTQQYSVGVVRGSLVVVIMGSVGLALARTTPELVTGSVLCALGDGLIVNLRALAIALTNVGHGAAVTTRMAAASTLGQMIGRPLMLAAFKWDNEGEIVRKGSPFLASAILYGSTLAFVLAMRLRWQE